MKKIIAAVCIVVLAISMLYIVFFYEDTTNQFITQPVKRMNIEQSIEAIGEVYAREQVDVGAQVSGQIVKLYVQIGDRVQAGDIIAQIDKDKQQNELDITRAQLSSTQANLESKKIAMEIAQKQYQREEVLYEKKAASLESLEALKNNYFTLKANVAELEAQVIQLGITLKNAQKDLDYTTITAPMNGVIINVAVDEGQTVNANQNTPTIVKIANLDEMEVRMQIAEADVNKIKVNERVKFAILSDPDTKYEAKIASIDPANTEISNSATNNMTSTANAIYYYVKFFVQNKDNVLRIGMSTENEIVVRNAQNTLAIPTYTIKNDRDGYYVEILHEKMAVKRYIKIGIKDALNTQVLEGLQENDELIVGNAHSTSATRIPRMR